MKIIHRKTEELFADEERGWAIPLFEGNYYIPGRDLETEEFKVNYLPGLCFYKFLYIWLDFHDKDGRVAKDFGWKYWFPNPLFPFIWFRVAVPQRHPDLIVVE